MESGELCCLMLVRNEHVHKFQQRTIEVKDRSRVKDGARANRPARAHRRLDCRNRNLTLNQHHSGNAHVIDRVRDTLRREGCITARYDHDAVGSGVIHFDQCGSAGAESTRDKSVIDAFGCDDSTKEVSPRILAHRTDHRDGCAESGGSDGLIEPLATRVVLDPRAKHGLAGMWQARNGDHDVDIQTAHDDHATWHGRIMVGTSNGNGRLRMNLGIDLGTGSVKAALVAPDGYVAARASKSYATRSPHPDWVEIDAREWVEAAASVMDAVDEGENTGITSVGFSGQMHGVVLVDDRLRPLRPAILWADTRSGEQARRMAADLGPDVLARLGSPAVAGFAATTLRWLADHEPEVVAEARYALQAKDFLRATLGGPIATDPSDASGTLLYDVVAGEWDADAISWAGIRPDMLPPVMSSTHVSGEVRVEKRTVPCAVGAADTAAAITGLGIHAGEGFIAVGTGAQVVRVMNTPTLDPALSTHTFCTAGAAGDGWYRIGAVQSAGLVLTAALAWLGASVEEASASLRLGVRADDPLFIPYLAGERTPFMNPNLRGSWIGLSLATDRAAMMRSVLEGVAQAVALGVEAVQSSGERLPEVVPLIGGGTQHPDFRQLLADCCQVPLGIAESRDSAVVGAATLAAGLSVNPHRIAIDGIVEPFAEAASLLAERRAKMVSEATTRRTTP